MTNQADKTSANAGQRGHTPGPWAAFPIPKDRLNRYAVVCVNDQHCPGAAKKVVACDIRTKEDADLIAAAPETAEERDKLREINAELLEALIEEHRACDWLMARLIEIDPSFLPSKSPVWPKIVAGNLAISKATGGAA